jgi:hypothetical protein
MSSNKKITKKKTSNPTAPAVVPPEPAATATPPPGPAALAVPVITNAGIDTSAAKESSELAFQTLVNGLLANYPATFVFPVEGTPKTRDELVTLFVGFIQASEATKAAKNAYHVAVDQERAAEAEAKPVRAGLETFFWAQFGKTSPQMRVYGYEPHKTPVKSAAVKAQAAAKGSVTRAANGKKKSKKTGGTTPPPSPPAA